MYEGDGGIPYLSEVILVSVDNHSPSNDRVLPREAQE